MDYSGFYPDETISSFLIRQIKFGAYPHSRVTQKMLWGNDNYQINTSFPSLIPWVSDNFEMCTSIIVDTHTSINYFRPFISSAKYNQVKQALATGDTEFVHKWLGITSNRINDDANMYYCNECVECDVDSYGVAYWHKAHQLYGVLFCPTHGCRLCSLGVARRTIKLPPQETDIKIRENRENVNSFSVFSQWALTQRDFELFEGKTLTNCYRVALFNKELACNSLRIRQHQLRKDLFNFYQAELKHNCWQSLFSTNMTSPYPQQLFYNYHNCHLHPAKHLALISYLFSTPECFIEHYQKADRDIEEHFLALANHKPSMKEKPNIKLIMKMFSKGQSLRSIARALKLSVVAVKSKVVAAGGKINSRASKIFKKERRAILLKLFKGIPTNVIAKHFKVSVGAVEQILTQHPYIASQRQHFRFREKQLKHRSILSDAMAKNPNYSRTKLKLKASASYLWLFKNDKQWLYQNLPPSKLNRKPEK